MSAMLAAGNHYTDDRENTIPVVNPWYRNRPVEGRVLAYNASFDPRVDPSFYAFMVGMTDAQSRRYLTQDTRLINGHYGTEPRVSPFSYSFNQNMTPDEVAVWMMTGQ
jgi:hypothetical protein